MDVYTVPFACGCAVLGIWLGLHAYAAYLSMSLRGIPGDDLFLIVRALRWVTDFHHRSYQLLIHKYHSHFVRLFLGARVVLVADAETYQRAFQSEFSSGTWRRPSEMLANDDLKLLAPIMRGSLFAEDGERWRDLRRRLSKGFHHAYLQNMAGDMARSAQSLASCWANATADGRTASINVMDDLSLMSLDVIGETAFGSTFHALGGATGATEAARAAAGAGILKHIDRMMQETTNGLKHIPGWYSLPTPGNRSLAEAVRVIAATARQLIERRRLPQDAPGAVGASAQRRDLLCIMLEEIDAKEAGVLGPRLSEEEVVNNAVGFILAGAETTSIALSWTLWLLATHPDLQERAAREADQLWEEHTGEGGVAGGGAAATAGDDPDATSFKAKTLPFTFAVLQEAMRLYPPAAINVRQAAQDTTAGGHRIPKGTWMIFSVWTMHRHPDYWGPTANEFDPDRFFDVGRRKQQVRGSYVPFSVGPRHCIGMAFAQNEMLLVLPRLLRSFRFRPAPGFEPQLSLNETLKPANGMHLRVSRRDAAVRQR